MSDSFRLVISPLKITVVSALMWVPAPAEG